MHLTTYNDGSLDKTIFANGTVYFHVPIDEKVILKNLVPCKKDTHSAIRRWCNTFGESVLNHAVFVLPFWLSCKKHGGDWGFSIGDMTVDDVLTNHANDVPSFKQRALPAALSAYHVPAWNSATRPGCSVLWRWIQGAKGNYF